MKDRDAISLNAAETGIRNFLLGIGEDPKREGLIETPKRLIKAWCEMTEGYNENPDEILSKVFTQRYDELVLVRDIRFVSLCEHHILPFVGIVTVGYLPDGRVVGLSKIPRLVQCFSKRLQIQERLTVEIATAIEGRLKPKGVGVIVKARHSCMQLRGVKSPGDMITSCLLGALRDGKARNEFLSLASVQDGINNV